MIVKILDNSGNYQYAIMLEKLKTYSAIIDLKNSITEILFFAMSQILNDDDNNINYCLITQIWDCLALLSAIDIQNTLTEQEAAGRFALDLPQYKETR